MNRMTARILVILAAIIVANRVAAVGQLTGPGSA